MCRGQGCFDSERPAGGYFRCNVDTGLKRLVGCRGNMLYQPHAQGLFGAPVISREHIAHRVSPCGLTYETDRRATAREPAVSIFVLTEARFSGGNTNVGGQVKLMAHVPRVAMNNDD